VEQPASSPWPFKAPIAWCSRGYRSWQVTPRGGTSLAEAGPPAVKTVFSKAKLGSHEPHAKDHSRGNGSLGEPPGLLPEPMFLRALCLERKRAERSRKLFMLML